MQHRGCVISWGLDIPERIVSNELSIQGSLTLIYAHFILTFLLELIPARRLTTAGIVNQMTTKRIPLQGLQANKVAQSMSKGNCHGFLILATVP